MPAIKQFNDEIERSVRKEKITAAEHARRVKIIRQTYESKIEELNRKLEQRSETKRAIINHQKTLKWTKKKYEVKIVNNDLRKKAIDIFYSRIKRELKRKSAYVDAISGYPILWNYCNSVKISPVEINFMIIAYHYSWINRKELEFYGYSKHIIASCCRSLVMNGYFNVERKSGSRETHYMCLPKAITLIEDFHNYYRKKTTAMFTEFDEKHKYYMVKPKLKKRRSKLRKSDENDSE